MFQILSIGMSKCFYQNLDQSHNLQYEDINICYFNECLIFELKISDKISNFVVLYRSPSQSQDEFETFSGNFEMNLEILLQKTLLLITTIGDIRAKSRAKW